MAACLLAGYRSECRSSYICACVPSQICNGCVPVSSCMEWIMALTYTASSTHFYLLYTTRKAPGLKLS